MKLLFVHDHIFRKVGESLYSTGGLNDEVLDRYTGFVDRMVVIARVRNVSSADGKWSKITNPKVEIKGTSSLKYNEMGDEIKKCDKLIVRLPSFLGLKALKENEKYKKPYLIEMVGCPWDSLWNHGVKGKIIAPYAYIKNRIEVKKAPYVLYVTNEFLQSRYPTKGRQIGCSDVVLQTTDEKILEKRKKKILSTSKRKIVIGTTAAIDVRYKGQQYIIEALGELKKRGISTFEYQLAGNGDASYLRNLAKKFDVEKQVVFLGGIPHENIFQWLDSIDLYVQPSRQEGLPRALVEAMSRGLPSFGAKTGGIPELLSHEFIFSNSHRNINEIEKILCSFDNKKMLEQAECNFKKSKEYQKEKLEYRRKQFYSKFFMS